MKTLSSIKNFFGVINDARSSLCEAKKSEKSLTDLKMIWGQKTLKRLRFKTEMIGKPSANPSTLFVGNHISYMDIPFLMSVVENISFVAKKELASWPIFGHGAKTLDTVFVNRESGTSRNSARLAIQEALTEGKRLIVFPSGTTCIDNSKSWRKGAFEIAANTQSFIQPFRIRYEPLRKVAFIDQDFFVSHLIVLLREKEITAQIEFHEPVLIKDPIKDCQFWQQWSQFKDS